MATAAKSSGGLTIKDAEADGWTITHREARVVKSDIAGGGGTATVTMEDESWIAERTVDDHRQSVQANSEERLLEAIEGHRTASALSITAPVIPVLNDRAGNVEGDLNAGVASILTETAVERTDAQRDLEVESAAEPV